MFAAFPLPAAMTSAKVESFCRFELVSVLRGISGCMARDRYVWVTWVIDISFAFANARSVKVSPSTVLICFNYVSYNFHFGASGCIACIRLLDLSALHCITLHCIHNTQTHDTYGECHLLYMCAWACDSLVVDETQRDGRSGA